MKEKKVKSMPMNTGISEADRKKISDGLSALLADSYTLYLMTHNFHWNVTGPQFNSLHMMFMDQYTEQWNALDVIAERIRALGFPAPGTYKEFVKLASIQEVEGVPKANEMIAYLKGAGVSLAESGIAPVQVAALAKLLATDAISSNQAHEVFEAMAQTGDDPNKIVDERGMRQVSDAGALQPIVDEVLANCADQAQQYRDGNQKVIGFLVGQCMKASRGKGNPKLFNELLRTSLS